MNERSAPPRCVYRLRFADHPRRASKWLVAGLVAYVVCPLFPMFGYLDDVIVCAAMCVILRRMTLCTTSSITRRDAGVVEPAATPTVAVWSVWERHETL